MIRIRHACDCDALVVGAGPAGATFAYHLANAGYEVWLIDRQKFPRDKVCGDFVGPVALLELKRLGLAGQVQYNRTNIIDRASLYLDGEQLVSETIPYVNGLPAFGRVIPRKLLDNWILDAARGSGAKLLESHCIKEFERTAEGITASIQGPRETRRIRTRLVIGADGSNSMVARFLRGYAPSNTDRIVAVRAYFEGVEEPHHEADLYFTEDSFPGYYWLFPTGHGTANVGVGMVSQTVPIGKPSLKHLLLRLIKEDERLHRRLHNAKMIGKVHGWPLTTYNHRLPIVGERIMLVGDAAGLINPLNGEGIQYALLSGRWAADVAEATMASDDFSETALAPYGARVEEELRYDMALSGMIVHLIRNRILNPVWLRALEIISSRARLDPAYAAVAGGVLAGLVPASHVLSKKIILGTIQQAVVSVGFRAAFNAIAKPAGSLRTGVDATMSGFKIAYDTLRNPVNSLTWGIGVAAGASELTAQVYRDMAAKRRQARALSTKYPAQSCKG